MIIITTIYYKNLKAVKDIEYSSVEGCERVCSSFNENRGKNTSINFLDFNSIYIYHGSSADTIYR